MHRLLDQLAETPAMVVGRRLDILAWNRMAAALYIDFTELPESQRNYIWLLFRHPAVRRLHVDWQEAGRTVVASLRMEAAEDPDDPQLAALVGELSVQDPDFSSWWSSQHVTTASHGAKHFRHPVVGDLTLDCDSWDSPDGHDQRLLVFTAEPGTPSDHALRILSSRTAQPDPDGLVPAKTREGGTSS